MEEQFGTRQCEIVFCMLGECKICRTK